MVGRRRFQLLVDPELALRWADRGLTLFADNYGLIWMRARALLSLNKHQEAKDTVLPLLALDLEGVLHETHAFPKSLFSKDTPALLGTVRFELAEFAKAADHFSDAAKASSNPIEKLEFTTKAKLARALADGDSDAARGKAGR